MVFSFAYHVRAIRDDPMDVSGHGERLNALLTRFGPGQTYLGAHKAWFDALLGPQDDVAVRARALSAAFLLEVFAMEEQDGFFADLGWRTFEMESLFEGQALAANSAGYDRGDSNWAASAAELAEGCRDNSRDGECPAGVAAALERLVPLLASGTQPAEGLRQTRAVLAELLIN